MTIVTLLVPTDFSAEAKAAAHFAAKLAVQIQARVILLSVVEMDTTETVLSNWKKLEQQLTRNAQKSLEKLTHEIKTEAGPKLSIASDVTFGIPMSEAIARYASEQQVNMIIMGTKGASGLKKILTGSNTTKLMQISPVPVIAIPAKAVYQGMKKMVYATDLQHVKEEIKVLARIAALFEAEILVFHCVPADSQAREDRGLEPELIEQAQYGFISFHQVKSDRVDKAIGDFIDESKADMLVMFTHELDFYEKLFGRSVTRSLAFQSRIPLLVFNRSVS
ncbi:MAG: universal stress protein [Cyclobacteriaceae bacterium]|nr:universal stress protein [Cyclobacteriaceae bacterium]